MKYLLLLPALVFATSAVRAQAAFSIGPTVGGNLATMRMAATGDAGYRYRLDWLAGAQAEVRWGKVAVQPALLFSQKGYKTSEIADYRNSNNQSLGLFEYRNNVRLGYLTLPLNVVYAPLGTRSGPQVFAGPYASVLLTARDVHTDLTDPTDPTAVATDHLTITNSKLASTTPYYGFRRFDAGLQGGLGYRYRAFQLQASYSLGLRTTAPQYAHSGSYYEVTSVYNRSFQLSLAYLFTSAH